MCSSFETCSAVTEGGHRVCICCVTKCSIFYVLVLLEACKGITVFLGRGWRTKKSNIRADAEARAREVIKEDYQKLGPTK